MTDIAEKRIPVVLEHNPGTPLLPGWIGLPEAGERIGVTRQHAYKMAKLGQWKSLHRIGASFVVVVSEDEVEEKIRAKESRNEENQEKDA